MARERADKNKTKSPKEERRTGKAEERMAARPDPSERAMSRNQAQHNSLQATAGSKKRQERQQAAQEPSADVRRTEKFSEHTRSASPSNGHQDIEDDGSMHRQIAERAFMLFQEHGHEHGNDWAHWFEAERQAKTTLV